MFALVNVNGKQYRMEEGRYLMVDHLQQPVDEVLELGNVLMVVDGETTLVGAPYVDGAKVKAKVLLHRRGPKILVYKMRCKKGYRRKNGHRQDYTQLQVELVEFPGRTSQPTEPVKPKERPTKGVSEKVSSEKTPKEEKSEKKVTKKAQPSVEVEKVETTAKPKKATKPAKASTDGVETLPSEAMTIPVPETAENPPKKKAAPKAKAPEVEPTSEALTSAQEEGVAPQADGSESVEDKQAE